MKTTFVSTTFSRRATTAALLLTLAGSLGAVNLALAASPAEMLEKGIYSEETKGDLNAAMTVYKQIVAEAKAGEDSAAQAQYHLGVCYYKKKDYTAASAAFEKLLKDFPAQKELAKAAREYLAGTMIFLPAPWADGEEMRLDLKLASGFKAGTAVYSVDAAETNGQKLWRFGSHLYVGVQQLSHVEVDADTLKPLHSRWKHTMLGDADTTYSPGHANIKFVGKDGVKKIDLDGPVYDNEEAVQAMRRLPLATNYSATLHIFTSLGGGNVIAITASVTGTEQVTVPAGTFDCYKVELIPIKQTFWYSTDAHRYVVKFEGGGVVAELAAVTTRDPNAPQAYSDSTFSLIAPADWLFFQPSGKQAGNKDVLMVLDPDGLATCRLAVQSLDTVDAGTKGSLRALADSIIAERKDELGLTVRTNAWQERTLAGFPALSFICDYTEGADKKNAYGVCSLGTSSAVAFSAMVSAKDFEVLRPKFDAIIDSYKPN